MSHMKFNVAMFGIGPNFFNKFFYEGQKEGQKKHFSQIRAFLPSKACTCV
jgi:hypothetical protein